METLRLLSLVAAILVLIAITLTTGKGSPTQAATFIYNDEAQFIDDLTALGYRPIQESFENDGVWGGVRTTIPGGVHTSPSVTSRGITWTPNNNNSGITTSNGAARTGSWGLYESPHGDFLNGINDGFTGSGAETLIAIGGWVRTNTPFAEISLILDGNVSNPVDFTDPILTAQPKFFGVIKTEGFTTFEFLELEGTLEDQKFIFADDFTFSTVLTSGICGDQNDDGNVDISDAIIDLQIIVGLIGPTEKQQTLSDVVRDGVINIFDVVLTLQHIVGLTEITECGPLPP